MAIVTEKLRNNPVKMHIAIEYDHNDNHVFMHADVMGFPRIVTNNGNNRYNGHKSVEIPVTEFVMWSTYNRIDHRSKRDMNTHLIPQPNGKIDKMWIDVNDVDHVTKFTYAIDITEDDGTTILRGGEYCSRHQTFERRINKMIKEINEFILGVIEE